MDLKDGGVSQVSWQTKRCLRQDEFNEGAQWVEQSLRCLATVCRYFAPDILLFVLFLVLQYEVDKI